MKERYLALGLMSGTSLDGVDVALIETNGERLFSLRGSLTVPYMRKFREKLFRLLNEKRTASEMLIAEVENELTHYHAQAIFELCKVEKITAKEIDVIGFHGQTIDHLPESKTTWQIGNGKLLAQTVGISVVNDFRSADMRAGGQGAPLVPIYHKAIVESAKISKFPVAILNIGGVANVTYIAPGRDLEMIAFDTGTGNALLDDLILRHTEKPYDEGGKIAMRGTAQQMLVSKWLQDSYFTKPYPKSLDRNHFHYCDVSELSLEDAAATLTAFTVMGVAKAKQLFPEVPQHWYVCGGGVHNNYMMKLLASVTDGKILPVSNLKIGGKPLDPDAIEAQAFAYLAVRSMRKLPYTFPTTTGVKLSSVIGGVFYPAEPDRAA